VKALLSEAIVFYVWSINSLLVGYNQKRLSIFSKKIFIWGDKIARLLLFLNPIAKFYQDITYFDMDITKYYPSITWVLKKQLANSPKWLKKHWMSPELGINLSIDLYCLSMVNILMAHYGHGRVVECQSSQTRWSGGGTEQSTLNSIFSVRNTIYKPWH